MVTQQNVRNDEDKGQRHQGSTTEGKCVTTERLRDAVMIPPGLKHAHLTFKFNESMLGKSHRAIGRVVIGPQPIKATYRESILNLKDVSVSG